MGIVLAAFDFDATILDFHTGGQWEGNEPIWFLMCARVQMLYLTLFREGYSSCRSNILNRDDCEGSGRGDSAFTREGYCRIRWG
jgi:hypothetical protein